MQEFPTGARPYRMRAKQAAAHIGVAVSHLYALVANGDLPRPQKVGRMSFWNPTELEAAFDRYASTRSRAA
jgi:predicted DNA-binding transcriptional regulator AlpA